MHVFAGDDLRRYQQTHQDYLGNMSFLMMA